MSGVKLKVSALEVDGGELLEPTERLLTADAVDFNDTILGSGSNDTQSAIDYIKQKLLFKDDIRSTTPLATESTSFQQYLRLQTTIPETGKYKIAWSFIWSLDTVSDDFFARVQVDDTTTLWAVQIEPNDSAGTGQVVSLTGGGTVNTGTDQRIPCRGEVVTTLSEGTRNIDLDWRAPAGGLFGNDPAAIYQADLTIQRWG